MNHPHLPVDFSKIKTETTKTRHNLVRIDNLITPDIDHSEWNDDQLDLLIEKIKQAKRDNRPIIWSLGAHVIKNGLSLFLIELIKRGFITHISGNGAASIHDFELAFLGGTSEDVATAIEDGSFGMWEETGAWMNRAIQKGIARGYGYGQSLYQYIEEHKDQFPFYEQCVVYQAWAHQIPATYHIALGTDIIHQHPTADFAALGKATGRDFHTFCESVAALKGGVFLNFGSSVIGPEVFLKALSIVRNLGYDTKEITTANFDLFPIDPPEKKLTYSHPQYYYRPRKNIVIRPTSQGGTGLHFSGDHKETIPAIYDKLVHS